MLRKGKLLMSFFMAIVFSCMVPAVSDKSEAANAMGITASVYANEEAKDSAGSEGVKTSTDGESDDHTQMAPGKSEAVIFARSDQPETMGVVMSRTKLIKYEKYHTSMFKATAGGDKYIAYCIEPTVRGAPRGKQNAIAYNDELMLKALYYSYGYPGYDKKTKGYLESIDMKKCYKGSDGNYALCHILLSYIYDSEKASSDAFHGVSAETKEIVKDLLDEIRGWPDHSSEMAIGFSTDRVKASWDHETKRQLTPEVTFNADEDMKIQLPIPESAAIQVSGRSEAEAGKFATIRGGETFSFSAGRDVSGEYDSGPIESGINSFQPYLLKIGKKQNQAFGVAEPSYISMKVDWIDTGDLILYKGSERESITQGSSYYSLKGAQYQLKDSESDEPYDTLITDENGRAAISQVPYGTYELQEIKAPMGYEIDNKTYRVIIDKAKVEVSVKDSPAVPTLATSAYESDSGEKSFYAKGEVTVSDNIRYSGLQPGIEYTIRGILVDKETGNRIEGTEKEINFTPVTDDGYVRMDFGINSDNFKGKSLVAFEKLYYMGSLIAVHEDINDEAQTVRILDKRAPAGGLPPQTADLNPIGIAMGIMLFVGCVIFAVCVGRRKRDLV